MKRYLIYSLLTVLVATFSLGQVKADVEEAPGDPGISGQCDPPTTNVCLKVKVLGFWVDKKGVLVITMP
jgi:hypothetical protein